jgi:hypothetical protein
VTGLFFHVTPFRLPLSYSSSFALSRPSGLVPARYGKKVLFSSNFWHIWRSDFWATPSY